MSILQGMFAGGFLFRNSMKPFNKVIIYYFTGTGNSGNVARWIQEISVEQNIPCEMVNIADIEAFPVSKPPKDSLIIMVSPVHGFNFPPVMISFIRHFPHGDHDVILMNTRAGMLIGKFVTPGLTGIAFYFAAALLLIKGFSIKGMVPVDMPSNWISIHPGLNKKTVLYLHERMKAKVKKYAARFLNGHSTYPAFKEIIQDVAISPISLGYYFIGRFILAKTFFAGSACNNCGVCIRKCPVKAIILKNDRPFWKYTCESCMRCMGNCPEKAIEAGHGFVLATALIFNLIVTYGINRLFPELVAWINPFLYEWVILGVLFLVIIGINYRLMHFLLRFEWFNRLMVYSSLTFYKFWGRRYRAIRRF